MAKHPIFRTTAEAVNGWPNEVRAEICECGCETWIHDIDGTDVNCPNCMEWCGEIDEVTP